MQALTALMRSEGGLTGYVTTNQLCAELSISRDRAYTLKAELGASAITAQDAKRPEYRWDIDQARGWMEAQKVAKPTSEPARPPRRPRRRTRSAQNSRLQPRPYVIA